MKLSTVYCPIFFILVHCSLLSRASTLPPSLSASAGAVTVTDTGVSSRASESILALLGSPNDTSFSQSATTTSSPAITSPFPSSLPTDRGDPHHDLHPGPSHHPPHKDNQTISNTGIILLSAFMLGLFGGVATCAWNYWRTPRRPAPVIVHGLTEDQQWLETILGLAGETRLPRPPPPPYFPRPPWYEGSLPASLRGGRVRSLCEWEETQRPADRRHSV